MIMKQQIQNNIRLNNNKKTNYNSQDCSSYSPSISSNFLNLLSSTFFSVIPSLSFPLFHFDLTISLLSFMFILHLSLFACFCCNISQYKAIENFESKLNLSLKTKIFLIIC